MKHLKTFFTALLLLCSTVTIAQKYVVDGVAYNILSEAEKTAGVTFLGSSYSSTPYKGDVVIPDTMYLDYKTYDNIGVSLSSSYNPYYTYKSLTMDVNAGDVLTFDFSVSISGSAVVTISIDGAEILNTSSSWSFSERYTFPSTRRSTLMIRIEKEERSGASASVTLRNIKITGTTYKYAVKSICENAFRKSTGLKSVVIGNSVTSIGNSAFRDCSGLTSIEIPNSVTSIGDYAFSGCSSLDEVYISDIAAWCNTSFSSSSANPLSNGAKLFLNGQELNELILPNDVIGINNYAFNGCTNIYSVTIGSSVLTMGANALPNGLPKVIFLGNTPPRDGNDKIYKPNAKMIYVSNADTYGYGIEYARLSSIFEVDGVKYVPLSTKECDVIDSRYNDSAANVYIDSVVTYKNRKMTVKNINKYACYLNNNIKQAYVNNDGYVGDSAFYNCDGILGDVIVENNGLIGVRAFYDCDSISGNVTVKNSGNIALQAFYDCDAIKSVDISNSGNVEERVFYSCDAMENAVISNKGYIGEYAFSYCSNLAIAKISNKGYIGKSAFYSCSKLVTADVFNNGNIGNNAFRYCTSLANLTLGENVDTLGNYAFANCRSLDEFRIPDHIPSMGEYCFSGCTSLKKMVVGSGIEQLHKGTYQNCTSLVDMTIGINVDTIETSVFYNCSSLPVINIPQVTKNVSDSVFYDCGSLSLVVFENRADSIKLGSNGSSPMFSSCPLDSVYIGGKLKYTTTSAKGYSPFFGNKSLRSVTYNDVETTIYGKEYMNCSNLQNVHLGNGIKSIGAEAFRNCSALPRITTPNSVTSMGKFAFAGCSSLKTVLIGDGTDGIKESSFKNCTSLVDIKLGSGIGSIAVSSFYNCSSLPEITIPSATTSIADSVFYNCKSLARFFAEDGDLTLSIGKNAKNANSGAIGSACPLFIHCQLDSVYLGRNLSYNQTQEYGYSPFYFNKTLRAVVIGDKVKSVFPNQFYQCRKLEYVSVGDGVTSVGNWAFSNCVSLDHFSFGVGLETIGKEAFSDCTLVTKIVSSREVPPVCGEQALADIDMWECTVYVPEEYIDAYMEADQWCEFWIEGAEYRLQFMVDGEVYSESMVKYNAEIELPVDPEKTGYTFKGWNLQGYSKSVWNEVKLAENADAMLYTNAPCTTSTYGDQFVSWNVLFDGNLNTLFHSEYGNRQTVDGLDHYLRVDMGEGNKVGRFKFTYTTRSVLNNNNVSPKTIVVEGSNTPDGEYTEIAMLTNLPGTKSTVYTSRELGNENSAYRYIRYRVIETHGNYKDNNHPYFAISEFGMSYEEIDVNFSMPERMPAYDMTVNAEFEANEYTITYIVDGEVYDTVTAAYESAITPIEAPEKDGYTFNRWEALPTTMPAEDIEVVAIYDEIPTEVTITIGQYGSTVYSSQYALDFSNVDGLQAYAATGYNTSTGVITMTKIETSAEGMGLYLLAAPGEYIVPIIEYSDDNSLNMLVGNLEKSIVNAVSDDGLFANYKYTIKSGDSTPKFYQYSDNSSISAGKAYLQISLDWIGGNASKAIEIRLDNGDATDIDEVKGDSTDDASQNGEVKTVYDLQGRAVENSSNGIYIVNGRKVYEK